MKRTAEERFWANVDKGDGAGCWLWTGYVSRNGYGSFSVGDRTISAHRYSWMLANGPIPTGDGLPACVCHRCDVRHCVRPSHFFLGTNAENTQDRDAKRRGHNSKQRGEANYNSKLTNDDVTSIRARCAAGELQRDVARSFGVGRSNLSDIVNRKTWTHVE